MDKNATTDSEQEDNSVAAVDTQNCMTPSGYMALQEELRWLLTDERPRITDIVSWAAGNGDRSENGDYLYNKKRLREIDRRLRYLMKRLDNPNIVDPKKQQGITQVFFGATVTYARVDGTEVTVKLVGVDEADFSQGKIYWLSPVGKALMKSEVGDDVKIRKESGREIVKVLKIAYLIN